MNTPILLVIFNRPDLCLRQLEVLQKIKPKQLYIACDGPRSFVDRENELVKESRQIISQITWDCDLKTHFQTINLGCKRGVVEAINWFFSQVEKGIILEDDCIPHPDFFNYAEKMLNLFKDRQEIFQVCGTNYLKSKKIEYPFISDLIPIWGWATWKNRWELYNDNINVSEINKIQLEIEARYSNKTYSVWMTHLFEHSFKLKTSTWDVFWVYTNFIHGGRSILPPKNLISNHGEHGTHSSRKSNVLFLKTYPLPLNLNSINESQIVKNKSLDEIQVEFLAQSITSENQKRYPIQFKDYLINLKNILKSKILKCVIYILRSILSSTSYTIKSNDNSLVTNFFNVRSNKRVLISFVSNIENENLSHSIFKECGTLAKTFHDLGFNVDLINYDETAPNISQYDVVVGFGINLEMTIKNFPNIVSIAYLNGCYPEYSNNANLKYLSENFTNPNNYLKSTRISSTPYHLTCSFSNYRIILGNKFTENTFPQNLNTQTLLLNAFFFKTVDINFEFKDFEKAKTNYLWMGGTGLLHKGLDQIINFFEQNQNLNLHICGDLENESNFFLEYKSLIHKSQNITYHGFIDLRGAVFKELMYKCGFVISNSMSEGGAVSTLNAVGNGGLIPIISESTGLSLTNAIVFDRTNKSGFSTAIQASTKLTPTEISIRSKELLFFVTQNFSLEQYQERISEFIKVSLNNN